MPRKMAQLLINPEINTKKITPEEEIKIFNLYKQFGNKWVEIAKKLPGRTENWVKNLYYATLRRYVRNINKFKEIQTEIPHLKDVDINEKMLAELFLQADEIDFADFQCIDSSEFKLLSKKVAKSRRRKDEHLVQFLRGSANNETRRKSKAAKKELTNENIIVLDRIKNMLETLQSSKRIKLAPVCILREEGKDGDIVKSRPRRRSTLKKETLKVIKTKGKAPIIQGRRRSKRIHQLGLKRSSKEFKLSAFVPVKDEERKSKRNSKVKDDIFPSKFEPIKIEPIEPNEPNISNPLNGLRSRNPSLEPKFNLKEETPIKLSSSFEKGGKIASIVYFDYLPIMTPQYIQIH